MPRIPSRESFAALTAAANAIAPVAMLGFGRRQSPNSLSIHYGDVNRIGGAGHTRRDVQARISRAAGASMLSAPEPASVMTERLSRLEPTAELLPKLLRVLDVRQIFECSRRS
jgi:hypothetical protein